MNAHTILRAVCPPLIFLMVAAAEPGAERTGLRITYPPDNSVTRFARTRIAGSCAPPCRVFIQGNPVRVYPTGAFVGLVPLDEGENVIEVLAKKGGEERRVRLRVTCRDPLVSSPVSPLAIDGRMGEPAVDTVLCAGDELRVQLKGSPGMKAFWSLGGLVQHAPLREMAPADEGLHQGIHGIYRASYRIRAGDHIEKTGVRFRLASGGGEETSAFSPGRVTLLPREELTKGEVSAEGAVLSGEPGGESAWELDPGARVNICGEAGGYYRLKLSKGERYWTAKEFVKPLKGEGGWGAISIGEPSLCRSEGGARLSVPLSGAASYRVTQAERKNLLVLELFGASPPGETINLKGVPPVKAVEFPKSESDAVRIVLYMGGRAQWGYRCRRTNEGLELYVRESPGREIGKLAIVIDPGHGGTQIGAVSPTGLQEKELNLMVARAVAEYLKARGARAVLTRNADEPLALADRIGRARAARADIFVSIHHDSHPGHCDPLKRRGARTYYGIRHSRPLAERIIKKIAKTGMKSNGSAQGNYAVILPPECLAVLVECGYLSHPRDEEMLMRKKFLTELGRAIGRGIVEYVEREG
jgi:N-acetylmuramoyl-L-alanine amidase